MSLMTESVVPTTAPMLPNATIATSKPYCHLCESNTLTDILLYSSIAHMGTTTHTGRQGRRRPCSHGLECKGCN